MNARSPSQAVIESPIDIRQAGAEDREAIWQVIAPVLRAGDTYPLRADIGRDDALSYWFGGDAFVGVAEVGSVILGTYYLRRNTGGGGAHVCNCGYAVSPAARGRGLGRQMALHSFETAKTLGFRAVQFNFVIATNTAAVHLWQSVGMEIVGTLPGAFDHPGEGLVDAYVMYRWL